MFKGQFEAQLNCHTSFNGRDPWSG